MTAEETLLEAIRRDPADDLAWLALADELEEEGRAGPAEVLRLSRRLQEMGWTDARRDSVQERLQQLVRDGVDPVMPALVNSIGMRLVLLPAGAFQMGSPGEEPNRVQGEGPRHPVEITRPFCLGAFAVTQAEYLAVMGTNPSWFSREGTGRKDVAGRDTGRFPVEMVNWEDAARFCERLSARPQERDAGRVYRLPTEAEWEYACRAGSSSPFYSGTSFTSRQANFDGNFPSSAGERGPYLRRTCAVGGYRPNAWGLFDMTGNVWQWCADWYAGDTYTRKRRVDPTGPADGTRRSRRGGSWYMNATQCRSAYRSSNTPTDAVQYCGFRVAMALPTAMAIRA
ncbi:MAG: formylglycine-generating enzyme family protein [Gemmataceae bacterium]|nr:formylglycine-generating enzyme family protein [Gemmataceae bacterium]